MNPISIVGAGPGAIDLITVRALDRLKCADAIFWTDSLVPESIVDLAPKDCERIKTSSLTLEEIIPMMIDRNKNGKRVVRLHDGDPCLYGAISEQIHALNKANIETEVIPGVSAYQATAASLQTELTLPGEIQTIILTRAGGRTGMPARESLANLARTRASICLYLSARHIESAQKALLEHYPSDTPVAIGYRVSWADESIKLVSLKDMTSTSKEMGLIRTTLYIISPALSRGTTRSKLYSSSHSHLFRQGK